MTFVTENLRLDREYMDVACHQSGRDPLSVRLVAVSKTVPSSVVQQAVMAGQHLFGENRVQETAKKRSMLDGTADKIGNKTRNKIEWHLIGPLQRNKVKEAIALFDLIHTVDSFALAAEINRHCTDRVSPFPILIQVNVGRESQKHGVLPEHTEELILAMAPLTHLKICGLMAIPPLQEKAEQSRPFFRTLRELAQRCHALSLPNVAMDELSMGMSGDFSIAIEEGATLVRVGSAIFSHRVG